MAREGFPQDLARVLPAGPTDPTDQPPDAWAIVNNSPGASQGHRHGEASWTAVPAPLIDGRVKAGFR